jgi:hypothetical protein
LLLKLRVLGVTECLADPWHAEVHHCILQVLPLEIDGEFLVAHLRDVVAGCESDVGGDAIWSNRHMVEVSVCKTEVRPAAQTAGFLSSDEKDVVASARSRDASVRVCRPSRRRLFR